MVILIRKTCARVEPALIGELVSVKSVVTTPTNENQADFGRKDTKIKGEVLKKTFFETFGHDRKSRKIARQFYNLVKLAA